MLKASPISDGQQSPFVKGATLATWEIDFPRHCTAAVSISSVNALGTAEQEMLHGNKTCRARGLFVGGKCCAANARLTWCIGGRAWLVWPVRGLGGRGVQCEWAWAMVGRPRRRVTIHHDWLLRSWTVLMDAVRCLHQERSQLDVSHHANAKLGHESARRAVAATQSLRS